MASTNAVAELFRFRIADLAKGLGYLFREKPKGSSILPANAFR